MNRRNFLKRSVAIGAGVALLKFGSEKVQNVSAHQQLSPYDVNVGKQGHSVFSASWKGQNGQLLVPPAQNSDSREGISDYSPVEDSPSIPDDTVQE